MSLPGVVKVGVIAERWQVPSRCAKRRLLKMNKRVGGGLMIQFETEGDWHVDISVLKRYLPGLVHDDEEDPAVQMLKKVDRMSEKVDEILSLVSV